MKNLVLAALVALSAAPAAFAMTDAGALSSVDRAAVLMIVPNADLDALTVDQAAAISSALYGSDRPSEAGQKIRAILN